MVYPFTFDPQKDKVQSMVWRRNNRDRWNEYLRRVYWSDPETFRAKARVRMAKFRVRKRAENAV